MNGEECKEDDDCASRLQRNRAPDSTCHHCSRVKQESNVKACESARRKEASAKQLEMMVATRSLAKWDGISSCRGCPSYTPFLSTTAPACRCAMSISRLVCRLSIASAADSSVCGAAVRVGIVGNVGLNMRRSGSESRLSTGRESALVMMVMLYPLRALPIRSHLRLSVQKTFVCGATGACSPTCTFPTDDKVSNRTSQQHASGQRTRPSRLRVFPVASVSVVEGVCSQRSGRSSMRGWPFASVDAVEAGNPSYAGSPVAARSLPRD